MGDYAVKVQNLSKRYLIGQKKERVGLKGLLSNEESFIWALKDINFELKKGERLGFVGKNGAGKSTLLKILSRVAYPTEGKAFIRGRVTSLLEVGTGFLNHLTGRQNIYLNASFHGLSKNEINERIPKIIDFSELNRFLDTPIKFYSSGMRARLAFSVAAHLDPDILILDEVLSVGDMAFAQKCLQRVEEMTSGDRTILFVSHSMDAVRRFCTRCIWLDCGQIVMDGTSVEVTNAFASDSMNLQPHQRWVLEDAFKKEIANDIATPLGLELNQMPHARLVSASVLTEDGRESSIVSADEEVYLEVVYDILYDETFALPAFRIFNDSGVLIFSIVRHDASSLVDRLNRGRYRSVAKIPANFLATGNHKVSIGLNTPSSAGLLRHEVREDALSFYVHEVPYGRLSALGPYTSIKGMVRPLCKWSNERL